MKSIDYEMYTIKEARERKLIQLYKWQPIERLDWLKSEKKRIGGDGTRIAIIVMKSKNMYSLFVDDIAHKNKAKPE